ncbi:MAG: cupin domain-containing protein [Candidatus Binataceae bacterium]
MNNSWKAAFGLVRTHVLLGANGEAKAAKIPGAYGHAQKTDGWFVGLAHIDKPARWWEVHPLGDELLFLGSGEIAVTIETGRRHRAIRLHAGEACVVPRGRWHRVDAVKAGELIFFTFQKKTRNRPI